MRGLSPNLDKGTIYDKNGCYSLTVYSFRGGGFEGTVKCRDANRYQGTKSRNSSDRAMGRGAETESSAPRRARTTIRRHVLTAGCDRMLTLTYRANFDDLGASDLHVTKLLRSMKRWHPDLNYVAVHEYQKRGAIHWHIALDQFVCVKKIRSAWHRIIGDLGGSVNMQYFPDPGRSSKYLCKYIGKDFDDDQRGTMKRYKRNRGLKLHERVYYGDSPDRLFQIFKEITGGAWNGEPFEPIAGVYSLSAY